MPRKTENIKVAIDPELRGRLEAFAERHDETLSWAIRRACRQMLEADDYTRRKAGLVSDTSTNH